MHIQLTEGKRYYSIGELAKAFDVNASLIRFWYKEFDILKPKKNAKGNRMFTPEDVTNLKLIFHLVKERGFTLEGAKTHLKEGQKKTLDKYEIIKSIPLAIKFPERYNLQYAQIPTEIKHNGNFNISLVI